MITIIKTFIFAILISLSTAVFANYGSEICNSSPFKCYQVKHGESWQSLFPDEKKRDLVMRINRMNTRIYSGLVIAIPTSNDTNVMDYSPMPKQISAPGGKLILVSLEKLAFGAYNSNGTLAYWGPVSGGKGYCSDLGSTCKTPRGKFSIQSKEGAGCISTMFPIGKGGAPMPYCMYFTYLYALHGYHEVPGYNASHGCVRVFISDARWLNREFTAGGHTTIEIE